jgi:glyoxylase-like metal-dependent hydrolase (beta-lactamase superfamily II)
MNRRTLIKTGVLAGISTFLPSGNLFATTFNKDLKDDENDLSGFKKLKLGELDFYVLSDGFIRDKNIDNYCPRADVSELKRLLKDNFRSDEYIDMAINILLVKKEDRHILFDAGLGVFADETSGFLMKSLAKTGFKPDQITDIFISHAHPDHIGGLLDKNGTFVFKNAKYHLSKTEFDFWMKASVDDFKNSGLVKKLDMVKGLIPKVRTIFKTIQPKSQFYDFTKPLYENFSFIAAPGHTPGMTLTKIKSGNEELLFVADLIHSDVLLFPHPEWGYFGDTDLDIAIASRKKILEELALSKTKAIGYHLPWLGFGYVKMSGNTFEWIQEPSFTP